MPTWRLEYNLAIREEMEDLARIEPIIRAMAGPRDTVTRREEGSRVTLIYNRVLSPTDAVPVITPEEMNRIAQFSEEWLRTPLLPPVADLPISGARPNRIITTNIHGDMHVGMPSWHRPSTPIQSYAIPLWGDMMPELPKPKASTQPKVEAPPTPKVKSRFDIIDEDPE